MHVRRLKMLPELNKVQLHGVRASIVCRLHFYRTETWTDSIGSGLLLMAVKDEATRRNYLLTT